MIKTADKRMTREIRRLWDNCFSFDDGGYTEYFFNRHYKPEKAVVNVDENNRVLSSLVRLPHEMMFNGRALRTSLIVGVCTDAKYRGQGHMKALMNDVLDECEHQELVTLIQAYDPNLYKQFGFELLYFHKRVELSRNMVKPMNTQGLTSQIDDFAMLKCYSRFVRHFNGFLMRDIPWFANYKMEIAAQKGKLLGYINPQGELEGYVSYFIEGAKVRVEEIIYSNSIALNKMVSYLTQVREDVILNTSYAEDLTKLYPEAKVKPIGFMMARVNDLKMWNHVFRSHATDTKSAFSLSKKPLFINDFA